MSESSEFRRSVDAGPQPSLSAAGDVVHVHRAFLSPFAMLKVIGALERLSPSWMSSEALGLVARGHTGQLRADSVAVQPQLAEIRDVLAPAALRWARACGFWFARAPHLQLFPVRMIGDAQTPAHQAPHLDSSPSQDAPPICTNVFYATTQGIAGGDLAVGGRAGSDLANPVIVRPTANTIATFAGDRVHWVQPLHAGERLSVVVNFY
jgi:hypothetical protein